LNAPGNVARLAQVNDMAIRDRLIALANEYENSAAHGQSLALRAIPIRAL
jgi:hypothetical protein